ncbi:MAG: VOC family protein [Armatimonadetes bacterium]|nr:VOC family protein [Armatimonadota bacterium]
MRSAPAFQVSHFSINVDDTDRAQKFYGGLFGWTFTPWGPPGFFLIDTGGIVHGAIQQRREPLSGTGMRGFEVTITVEDVDVTLAKAVEMGATVHFPKSTIPTVGDIATFYDPEGNYVSIAKYES